jgi:hypothetical protein
MTPFYRHLKGVPGFDAATSVDRVGLYATAAVGAAFTAHTLVQIGKRAIDKRRAAPPPVVNPEPPVAVKKEDV